MNAYAKVGILLLCCLILVSLFLLWPHTKHITIELEREFGGEENEDGWFVLPTTDHGCIVTGYTRSYGAGGSDIWVVKIDENGNEQWNRTYGGKNDEEGRSIVKTHSGGYAIAGGTFSYGNGGEDFWLVKIDGDGKEEWNSTFGSKNDEYCNQIIQTSDNGFLLVGHSINGDRFSGFIVKTTASGTLEWEKLLEEETQTGASSCEETKDGYIIVGYIGVYGKNQDLLVIKLDMSGRTVWTHAVGGDFTEAGVWVKKILDKRFFITGYKDERGSGTTDLWLLKIEAD